MIEKYLKKLEVLFEDNHILIVIKFPNVLSQKDETNDISMNEIIKEYIKRKHNKPGNVYLGLIHRLDRRVGGVMVFAKTSKAASRLSDDIRNHKFHKKYIAFCEGSLDYGFFKDYLVKDEKKHISIVAADGKEAFLEYSLINKLEYNDRIHSYIWVNLKTGRYNQIRCQMSYHSHPLVNDCKYGYKNSQKDGEIGLWCYEIGLIHPITKEYMFFSKHPEGTIWDKLDRRRENE